MGEKNSHALCKGSEVGMCHGGLVGHDEGFVLSLEWNGATDVL